MKLNNQKIKRFLQKLASLNTYFKRLVERNSIETIRFKMLDNALYQNLNYNKNQRLEPWENKLEKQFLFYFIHSGIKIYIYIWVDKKGVIMEIEFMCMGNCDDNIDFIELALNGEIYIENIIDRTKKS